MIEFGAVVLDKTGLYEKECFSTLIRPNPDKVYAPISKRSVDCNGITDRMVAKAPSFSDVSDQIYKILHGRIWAGHNIVRFDNRRIEEEFKAIGKQPPTPKGIIDTLPLLRRTFGKERAGNLKMATLGHYFGLGAERHRALEDARMNINVLQRCATVLFLESHARQAMKDSEAEQQVFLQNQEEPIELGLQHLRLGDDSKKLEAKERRDSKEVNASTKGLGLSEQQIAWKSQLQSAMNNKKVVWITYTSANADKASLRQVQPIRWSGGSRFVALCIRGQVEKHYRLDRLAGITLNEYVDPS